MSKVLPVLAGLSMLGLVGMVNAAEPVILTDAQMDEARAGITGLEIATIAAFLSLRATDVAIFCAKVNCQQLVSLIGNTYRLLPPNDPALTNGQEPPPLPPGFYQLGGQPPAR